MKLDEIMELTGYEKVSIRRLLLEVRRRLPSDEAKQEFILFVEKWANK